jgi:RimJ/RimL family protein N-acetyltransferase
LIDPVKIRKANMKDCNILFEWANDPLSRKNSFNPAQIKYESHKKWLAEKFEQKTNIFYIIEFENQKAALVRFERKKEETTVIGIHIDKKFRGRGLASEFIIKASKKYLVKNSEKISAFIKIENMASIKSFTKAGFLFERETEINKQKCHLLNFQK